MAKRSASYLFFVLFVCRSFAFAQTPDTATLNGHIVDQSQAAVEGVDVTATNALSGLTRTAQTNQAGDFSFPGLPIASTYTITAAKSGFTTAKSDDLRLLGGSTADLNLQLNLAAGQTQINVTGTAGEVRADAPQLGDTLSAGQMEETPLLDRKITYLPLLNAANRPAINQGDVFMNENLFTSNGAGRRQTWFEVDGSTGNDSWGRQTIFSNIPLAAVQEMDVVTNAFSAEYGGSTGTVVNIITKSGGNQWHGEALGMGRPSATEASLAGFTNTNAASGNDLANATRSFSGRSIRFLSRPAAPSRPALHNLHS